MEKLNKLERRLYVDVLITVLLVVISIPVWLNFELTSVAALASGYDNYNYVQYELLNEPSKVIQTYSDAEALRECETQDIIVYNDSNTVDDYSLILKINKGEDIVLDDIKLNVNYDVDYLSNYKYFEDEVSYYYIIDKAELVADAHKYAISMWNSNLSSNISNIEYEFVVL